MNNIIELAKNCPDIIVNIRLSDLIEANQFLIKETQASLEKLVTDANTETYPGVDKVAELLGVTKTTLWRWDKGDYLKPVSIGGKRRYKMSDVRRILEGGRK